MSAIFFFASRVSRFSQILKLSVTIDMPPTISASTSKRKASPSPSDEEGPKVTKKSKVSAASVSRYSDQPTNKVLPVNIDFPPRVPNTLRFATWNIAGLAASQKKGFKYYVEAEDPDILVLTETKVRVNSRLLAWKSHFL
jgi:AP endonuclease-1